MPPLWPDLVRSDARMPYALLALRQRVFWLNKLALTVVDHMLDELRRPAGEVLLTRLQRAVHQLVVRHLDAVVARTL